MTILSWNVRGLNDKARRDTVCTLVDDIRPSIVCLQETKLDVISQHLMYAMVMLGIIYTEFAYLPASNTRGSILIAARETDVSISDVLVGCYSLTVRVRPPPHNVSSTNCSWRLSSVYGPQEDGEKIIFLEELEAIRDESSRPWAVNGDFNLILLEADKNNNRIHRANLARFR
jgi:exonuclease III